MGKPGRDPVAMTDLDHISVAALAAHEFRVDRSDVDGLMDRGRQTFVLDIPPRFEADVLAGLRQQLQSVQAKNPQARIMDGRFMVIAQGIALPRARANRR